MGKHTPGPWGLYIDGTCSGAWPFICPVGLIGTEDASEFSIAELPPTHTEIDSMRGRGPVGSFMERPERFEPTADHDEIMANAHLIAAAPELLAFAEHVKTLAFDFINEGIRPQDHHMRELAWKANAVAAKTTGESHG